MTTLNLDEYRTRTRDTESTKRRVDTLQGVQQEGVRAKALTGSAEWDTFLRYLEAQIANGEAIALNLRAKLTDPLVVEHDAMLKFKVQLARIDAQIMTLQEVLMLPKFIIEKGAKARDELDKLAPMIEE